VGNRADDEGIDVAIYIKPLTDTVHADTPTGADEQLLDLLDRLGFERQTVATPGPVYTWHEVPDHLDEDAKKQLATHAVPWLLKAGYEVHITDDVWDSVAYTDAVAIMRYQNTPPPPATVTAVRTTGRTPGTRLR
jgi:hypothetical protein